VNYLRPQWGGSYEAVDRFVEAAVARTRATQGESFYAWIYLDIAPKVRGDLFRETLATWPKMKKSFEDLVARHPDPYNRNAFASVACLARDRDDGAAPDAAGEGRGARELVRRRHDGVLPALRAYRRLTFAVLD
jgi:hypothetical protein